MQQLILYDNDFNFQITIKKKPWFVRSEYKSLICMQFIVV